MNKKIILILPFISTFMLSAISCNTQKTPIKASVLTVFGGEEATIKTYSKIVDENMNNDFGVKIEKLNLGSLSEFSEDELESKINAQKYDNVILFGDDLIKTVENTIKIYQRIKFVSFDAKVNKTHFNEVAVDFVPEHLGYLGGLASSKNSSNNKVGYFVNTLNHFDNRRLYGFLQGVKENEPASKVLNFYFEEKNNYDKTIDYLNKAVNDYQITSLYEDVYGNIDTLLDNKKDLKVIGSSCVEDDSRFAEKVVKNYDLLLKETLKNISNNSYEYNKSIEYGFDKDFISYNKSMIDKDIQIDLLKENEYEDFDELSKEMIINSANNYNPQYTSTAKYHEAVPQCSDVNNWKYAPRPGADNGLKPVAWKAIGPWATIYTQDQCEQTNNTGIEFENMKIYGYSKRKGWKLIEHANPVGSFYDENFTNDSSKDFSNNMFNFKDIKRTKILLNKATKGFNYHPFGVQNDLEAMDFLDVEYILSTMNIHLIDWDPSKKSDINDAKYVANIGADWWSYKGATWLPDWSANRDVCVGQFRTITKEWKTLYMTSVPPELYDELIGDLEFLK